MSIQPMTEWRDLAACQNASSEEMVPENPADDAGVWNYCAHCPVRQPCLKEAIEGDVHFGIWGGMTELERAPLHGGSQKPQLEIVVYTGPVRPDRSMTHDEILELADLRGARNTKGAFGHEQRRAYRLKVGEFYTAGVDKHDLLNAGVLNERSIWRASKEYRVSAGLPSAERPHQAKSRIQAQEQVDEYGSRAQKLRRRARRNYSQLAKTSPSPVARSYWANYAATIS